MNTPDISTKLYVSKSNNPYRNIAIEEALLLSLENTVCLYIWQNDRTVVIGRNQNAWAECRTELLAADGGRLARRLSGGGAVYHDIGNLCFTFITPSSVYNVERQTGVILDSMRSLGFDAVTTGRNDVEIDGRKFSGHAYYKTPKNSMHHGTVLVNANLADAQRYLSPPQAKINSKGVQSVRGRIINLCEINHSITTSEVSAAMTASFLDDYGGNGESIPVSFFNMEEIERREKQLAAAEWLYGRSPAGTLQFDKHFDWGSVSIYFDIVDGLIKNPACFSDAMDITYVNKLQTIFDDGTIFAKDALMARAEKIFAAEKTLLERAASVINELID